MIDGICRANNKHPSEDEARRVYFKPGEKISGYNGDLCARLKPGFLKLDIDDFDHRMVMKRPGSVSMASNTPCS